LPNALANEADERIDEFISGRVCNFPMEGKIGIDTAFLPALIAAHPVKGITNKVKRPLAAPLRCQSRGLRLENIAQFEKPLHAFRIAQGRRINPDDRAFLGSHHKCTDSLPRHDNPVGPQLGYGFPDHIAAHTETFCHFIFCWQPRTCLKPPGRNFPIDGRRYPTGQMLVSLKRGNFHLHDIFLSPAGKSTGLDPDPDTDLSLVILQVQFLDSMKVIRCKRQPVRRDQT